MLLSQPLFNFFPPPPIIDPFLTPSYTRLGTKRQSQGDHRKVCPPRIQAHPDGLLQLFPEKVSANWLCP